MGRGRAHVRGCLGQSKRVGSHELQKTAKVNEVVRAVVEYSANVCSVEDMPSLLHAGGCTADLQVVLIDAPASAIVSTLVRFAGVHFRGRGTDGENTVPVSSDSPPFCAVFFAWLVFVPMDDFAQICHLSDY